MGSDPGDVRSGDPFLNKTGRCLAARVAPDLAGRGFGRARVLGDGLGGWMAGGRPTERGDAEDAAGHSKGSGDAMEMLVKDWMNPHPLTVESRATAAEAKAMMEKYWMRHLLVMEGPTLVGILSDRDIRSISLPPGGGVTAAERDAHLHRQVVGTVMTRDPRTVRSETPLRDVARLMLEHKFGGVPVVDGGRVMGIITETDVLRAFIKLTEVDRPG